MPEADFSKPMISVTALEPFALALSRVMVALRNEAQFCDIGNHTALEAATLLTSMLEDAHAEAALLNDKLELRVAGKDLTN